MVVGKAATKTNDTLVELVTALDNIKENADLEKLNAYTISDNNGGRIIL